MFPTWFRCHSQHFGQSVIHVFFHFLIDLIPLCLSIDRYLPLCLPMSQMEQYLAQRRPHHGQDMPGMISVWFRSVGLLTAMGSSMFSSRAGLSSPVLSHDQPGSP